MNLDGQTGRPPTEDFYFNFTIYENFIKIRGWVGVDNNHGSATDEVLYFRPFA